ncbi:MAG: DUF58 domain-containing protein [Proteobacteria bacterium]|jgi:uncharacterized protein (DUF58 family)|nr:DUF58 domain-containing protein [Pseudomonadota bacterium]
MSIPDEVLKKVKLLEISTRKLVNNTFAGEYHTAFKGQGMTFADFREYVPGDDVRTISWALTARAGKPYIKKFDEEREMSVILAVDVSGSSDFGSKDYFKGEVLTHLAALIAFSAVKNKDQVGLLLFSDQVEHYVPPGKGRGHIHRLLRDLLYHKPKSRMTKMSVAFQYLQSVQKKRALIFILSDFADEGFESSLRLLGKKHEVLALQITDPLEKSWPQLGLIEVQDAETGELALLDTDSLEFRKAYQAEMKKQNDLREKWLRASGVAKISISTAGDYVVPLIQYFKSRRSR